MNKIEQMLQELCPEGVEYKKLGEIGTFIRGNGLQKKDFTDSGVGCIHYGQIYTHYGFYTTQTKSFVDESLAKKLTKVQKGDIIIACTSENIEDICKAVAWLGDEDIVTGGHACVFTHNESPKYISYFFQTEMFFQQKKKYARGAKVIDIKISDLSKIEIPVPPLPIQEEIVRILDHFTALAAELQAELQARQEQYEYYRNKLLTFTKIGGGTQSVTWMKMSEIGEICMCKRIMKHQTNIMAGIPFYKIGTFGKKADAYIANELYEEYKKNYSFPRKGEILLSASGTIGKAIIYNGEPAYFQDSNIIWISNDESKVLNKFLYYYYQIAEWKTEGGTIKRLYNANLAKMKIAVPTISEQQRIVSILDKFEALVNDLSQGLPAEIAAVQEQYEYYRNRLLAFKKRGE